MRPAYPGYWVAYFLAIVLAASLLVANGVDAKSAPRTATTLDPPGSLELTVVDATTGEPVPWANLVRVDAAGGWVAGEDGVVRPAVLPPGAMSLQVVHLAYEPSEAIHLLVVSGETIRRTVPIEPRTLAMPTVDIRADQQISVRRVATGVRRLTAEEGAALPNPKDDVFQMIRVLPGAAVEDVGSEFHLRGGGIDETLVRIDGMEVQNLLHGRDLGGITGILPYAVVQSMDVYPSAFPARYGGRLSGAIDIDLRDTGRPGMHGRFAADAVSARALTEAHGSSASLVLSAREGYLDRVLDVLQDQAVIQPAYRDFLVRTVYHPDPTRTVSVNYLRSEDHLLFEDGVELHFVDADYLDQYFWTTWSFTPADRFGVTGTLHGTGSEQKRRVEGDGHDDQRYRRAGARLELRWLAPGGHLLRVGGEADQEWGTYSLRGSQVVRITADGSTAEIPDYAEADSFDRWRTAIYLQDEWRPLGPLALNLGLRSSHDTDSGESVVSPRSSAALELPGRVTLQGAWGLYSQAPVHGLGGGGEVRVVSDRPERAEHLLAGVEKRFDHVRVGVDVYEKRFLQLDGVVRRTVNDVVEHHSITHGSARGLEIYLNRRGANLNWWLSYSLGRSEWGNDEMTFSRDYDRLHAFSLSQTYRFGENWDVGATWSWHSGSPYTAQEWRQDGKFGGWILNEGMPNAERLPQYQRVDLRVRRHFRFDGWRMSVYAEGLNLTNHDNVMFYSWAFRKQDDGLVPERITRTGVPGVPSIGLEIRF